MIFELVMLGGGVWLAKWLMTPTPASTESWRPSSIVESGLSLAKQADPAYMDHAPCDTSTPRYNPTIDEAMGY